MIEKPTATIHHEMMKDGENNKEIWYYEIRDQTNNIIETSSLVDTESLARYGIQLWCKLNGVTITEPFIK
jgi:hypothetical protein